MIWLSQQLPMDGQHSSCLALDLLSIPLIVITAEPSRNDWVFDSVGISSHEQLTIDISDEKYLLFPTEKHKRLEHEKQKRNNL